MSVFPLNIPEKTNTPALLAFFQQFGLDKYLSAEEINKITEALTELKEVSANVSIVNTIFVNNGFEKVDQLFTAFANSEWNINGINYTNLADQVITIPLCATGKVRTDRIVLDTNNNFVRVPGVEVDENPVAEAKPVNTLDYTFIPVNDAEVGDPSSPVIGNTYQKKQFDYLQTYTGTGTDVVIPLNTTGRSHIQLKGTMTSVAGLSFADLVANPVNAEYPHYGKRYLFFNDSGHDIILKHLAATEDIFFTFKEETDLVFPNGEFLEFFNGGSNVFVNVFRSWKDISNKLNKDTSVNVEKVYIKNADGTQSTKPTSDFGTIKGTGTNNSISKFTASGTIADSQIFDNGTNVGIGTTSPQARLDVRAQGVLATDIVLRVRNSTDTQNFLVVNGAGDVYNNGAKGVNTNTFFGENVGRYTTGAYNTAIGANALGSNTIGAYNTAIGASALLANTTGNSNMAIGFGALYSNTTGAYNTAIGQSALQKNTTGYYNTAFGQSTLFSNTTGSSNTAIGQSALQNNTTGYYNTAFGQSTLFSNTTGYYNTAIGQSALQNNTTGAYNTAFGREAGRLISNGSNNTITNNSIFIGGDTRALNNNETNQIVIGYRAIGLGSNSVVLGNELITITQLRGQVIMGAFASEPTGIVGAIYYDSTTKKHRGFNGVWNDLY